MRLRKDYFLSVSINDYSPFVNRKIYYSLIEVIKMSSMYERIKRLCDEHNITVAELERKCGLSPSTIRKWDGNLGPTVKKINKVADYFNVSIDYLCDRSITNETADDTVDEQVKTFYRVYSKVPDSERGVIDAMMDAIISKYSEQ